MDLLRTEIQRLKSIDIYSYPSAGHREPCLPQRPAPSAASQNECLQSRRQVNTKLMQLGLASYKQISDSETSERDCNSDVADFEGFIEQLRAEKRSSSQHPSSTERSEASSSHEDRRQPLTSTGTDPIESICLECATLQQDRFQLMHRLYETEQALQIRTDRLGQAEEEISRFNQELFSANSAQPSLCDTGIMTDPCAPSTEESRRETRNQCVQCDSDMVCDEALEEELSQRQSRIEMLESTQKDLIRENELLKDRAQNKGRSDPDNAELAARIESLLLDAGIETEQRLCLAQEIQALSPMTAIEAALGCDERHDPHPHKERLQDAPTALGRRKDAEIFNLNEEKEVLTRKIMELRKAVKKETCDKEAAAQQVTKLQSDLAAQQSEMEQCRNVAQQKRQQVDALEDTLAIVQHENEKWERDYELLIEKKDQLERQIRIARNLECSNG